MTSTSHAARSTSRVGEFTLCHGTDTNRRGFHITFENGWTISVQWGAGTYSDNHDAFLADAKVQDTVAEAEVAFIDPQDAIVGEVHAYCSPAKVLALMTEAASR
jgi:hypothetical protein